MQAPRSLKHEYQQYLEDEIEAYKESLPRVALLALGDDAVEGLRQLPEVALDELVLCEEVDRIVKRRLKLPSYRTWRRRYMARLAELRRPEHWGIATDASLALELIASRDGEHVFVADADGDDVVLLAAALGCTVTAVAHEPEAVGRMFAAAEASGLGRRLQACVGDLDCWTPEAGLRVVLCSTGALARVDSASRADVIDGLQRATLPGGIHFVRAPRGSLGAGDRRSAWVQELEPQYVGWVTALEDCGDGRPVFVARKPID